MEFKAKVLKNKRNNQLSISIPKKKFLQLKKGDPKFIKIRDAEFEY